MKMNSEKLQQTICSTKRSDKMKRMDYTQAVVRIRVLEKELLTQEKFEQMLEANDLEEVYQILQTTKYAKYIQDDLLATNYEQILTNSLLDEYRFIQEIAIDPEIVSLLLLKYDFHNLKVLCKELFTQENLSHLYSSLSTLNMEDVKEKLKLTDETEGDFVLSILHSVQKDYLNFQDPQRIDLLLDRFYIKALYELVHSLETPLFKRYLIGKVDFNNVITVLRARNQKKDLNFLEEVLLDYGSIEKEKLLFSLHDSIRNMIQQFKNETIGSHLIEGLKAYEVSSQLVSIEKERDNYLLEVIDEARNIHFGPEPLIAYLFKKENEVKILRMIFIAKLNNISKEKIQKRMRNIYV